MSKKKREPLRIRYRHEKRAPTPVRRFLIDRETGITREIEPAAAAVHSQDTHEDLSLVESERARLRELARLLSSDRGDFRELGEEKLETLAQRLAAERNVSVRQKAGSDVGAQKRRQVGERKERVVLEAIAKGTDPPASDRHVRRIKNRPK